MLIEEYELVDKEVNYANPPKPKRARQNTSNDEGASQSLLWTLMKLLKKIKVEKKLFQVSQ